MVNLLNVSKTKNQIFKNITNYRPHRCEVKCFNLPIDEVEKIQQAKSSESPLLYVDFGIDMGTARKLAETLSTDQGTNVVLAEGVILQFENGAYQIEGLKDNEARLSFF